MGIRLTSTSKAKATLKLSGLIATYLFEQEYGELEKYATKADINDIKKAQKALNNIIEKGKK